MSQGVYLDGGRELSRVTQDDPELGRFLERVRRAINFFANNVGAAPLGELPPPPPVESTTVKGTYNATTNILTCPGEILHFVHTHNAPLQRGIQYITEVDTDPSFSNAHPINTGSSRTGFPHLPALDDNGNPVSYYLRAIAQTPGSGPSTPTVFGNVNGAIKIQMTGSTQMSLLTSQGGGTEATGQHGQGLGNRLYRAQNGRPKRTIQ